MAYADWLLKLVPTSLRRARWALYLQGLGEAIDGAGDGTIKDASGAAMVQHVDDTDAVANGAPGADFGITARAKFAVKARFPDVEHADPNTGLPVIDTPPDAIDATGGDRLLERGTSTDLQFGIRLRQAWGTWAFGGTAYGLLLELWHLGYHNVHVVIVNGLAFTLQSATGNPTADMVTSNTLTTPRTMHLSWWPSAGSVSTAQPARRWWTRFAVIFDSPLPTRSTTGAPSDWTTAIPADTSDEANAVRRIINRWRPAYAICDRIVILSSGWVLGWPLGIKLGDVGLAKLGHSTVTYWST